MALTSFMTHGRERVGNPLKIRVIPLFLLTGFSLAYIFLAPNLFQQDWDSLMYAYWAEINGISSIWGNHPLGHLLLNSINVLLMNLGFPWRALQVFIVCNGLLSGTAVALFFFLMKEIGIDDWLSLGYAVVFGASYGIWHFSGSADIYSLSVLLLIAAWISLLYEVQTRKARTLYLSGALAGLSVLSHQLNVVFFFAAFVIIVFQKKDRWPRMITFGSAAFVLILIGGILLGSIAISSASLPEIYDWFRGYLGDDIYGEPLSIESIVLASRVALQTVLVAPTWLGEATVIRTVLYSFLFVLILLGVMQVKRLNRGKKIILLSAFIQCLVSFLLIAWFEPWYPKFWLLVLVPAMIGIACCIDALMKGNAPGLLNFREPKKYYSHLLLLLPGIIVLVFNLRFAILNEHTPDEASQRSLNTWLEHSDPDDMLITAGDLIPQLWFWSNRPNTIHLYHSLVVNKNSDDRFEYLRAQINRCLCEGDSVLYTPAIVDHFGDSFLGLLDLSRVELRTFFDGYEKESAFIYRNRINNKETQVYTLMNPDACSE